jgi:butyrate kinase
VAQLVRLCWAGRHIEPEMLARISGRGGSVANLGTSDPREGGQPDRQRCAVGARRRGGSPTCR